jgi:hypothetical protein
MVNPIIRKAKAPKYFNARERKKRQEFALIVLLAGSSDRVSDIGICKKTDIVFLPG